MSELPEGFVLEAPQGEAASDLPPGFVLEGGESDGKKPFGWADTWPAKIAKSIYSGVTLPGDVLAGRAKLPSSGAVPGSVPFGDPESAGTRVGDLATLAGPASVAAGSGRGIAAVAEQAANPAAREAVERGATLAGAYTPRPSLPAVREAVEQGETLGNPLRITVTPPNAVPATAPSGVRAAQTAADLGAPLPVGLASDNKAVQAITQASRQLPFVGQGIEERAANTVTKAGEAVNNLAADMAGGVVDRAGAGASLKPAIADVVEANRGTINEAYGNVRAKINPNEPVVPETVAKVYDQIIKERRAARQANPEAGLENIRNMVENGISFDGLVRAKSDLAHTVDFLNAHAGFSNADKKRLGAAMSRDLGAIATATARPGVRSEHVEPLLRSAEGQASKLIEQNRLLQRLIGSSRDETISGALVNASGSKGGNIQLLAQLKGSMKPEDFQQIGGTVLHELGHNPALPGEFSLAKFGTKWNSIPERTKNVLYGPQHRRFLDDIANLSTHLKAADTYRNTSGTGRAVAVAGALSTVGTAGAAAAMGNPYPLIAAVGSMGAGYTMARLLARPAGAATVAKWMRAAQSYSNAPSPPTMATLSMATRNLLTNVRDVSPSEFVRLLKGPVHAEEQSGDPNR